MMVWRQERAAGAKKLWKYPDLLDFPLEIALFRPRLVLKSDLRGVQIYARAQIPDISNLRISYQGGGKSAKGGG